MRTGCSQWAMSRCMRSQVQKLCWSAARAAATAAAARREHEQAKARQGAGRDVTSLHKLSLTRIVRDGQPSFRFDRVFLRGSHHLFRGWESTQITESPFDGWLKPGRSRDLNGSTQHQARIRLALKTKAKIACWG